MNAIDTMQTVLLSVALLAAAVWWARRYPIQPAASRLADLERNIKYLQDEDIRKGREIIELREQLATANVKIASLEGLLAQYRGRAAQRPERILLAVIGNAAELKVDAAALREVEAENNLTVIRCLAQFRRMEAVLNRHRAEGAPIRNVHISVHATAERVVQGGIAAMFDDGGVTGEQLSGVLNGVEVLMVAGCDSDILGDLLGVVPAVITFTHPVRHEHATLATKLFWSAIGRGAAVRDAYRETRERLPAEAAEMLELHQ